MAMHCLVAGATHQGQDEEAQAPELWDWGQAALCSPTGTLDRAASCPFSIHASVYLDQRLELFFWLPGECPDGGVTSLTREGGGYLVFQTGACLGPSPWAASTLSHYLGSARRAAVGLSWGERKQKGDCGSSARLQDARQGEQ